MIDEISMVPPGLLYRIIQRLKEIRGVDTALGQQEFAGYVILLCGDFWQIPPVKSRTIIEVCFKGASRANIEESLGAEIFKKARVFQLQKQMRAEGCEKQRRLVELLRSPVTNPITDAVLQLVQPFSRNDVVCDQAWKKPTFLVGTNKERRALNKSMLVNFAKSNGHPILSFKFDSASFNAQSNVVLPHLYKLSCVGTGYFVKDAPIMITMNIRTMAGVSNGVCGKMHSFAYNEDGFFEGVKIKLRGAQPGEFVPVPCPDYLIVELPQDEKYNQVPTLSRGTRLIPLPLKIVDEELDVNDDAKKKKTHVSWKAFPCELAYAITFHKCQGLTLERVVVCAPKRVGRGGIAITYEMILVALTRTTKNDHVRFMPSNLGFDMSHLKKLVSNQCVLDYFAGRFVEGIRQFD